MSEYTYVRSDDGQHYMPTDEQGILRHGHVASAQCPCGPMAISGSTFGSLGTRMSQTQYQHRDIELA